LIILYANEKAQPDERFTQLLQKLFQTSPYKEKFENRVFILNTSSFIGKADRFSLDDHYNKFGHEKIAIAIKNIISEHPLLGAAPAN